MWIAALRRFALLVIGASAATTVASLAIGALLGATAGRSVSLGFDVVGAFVLMLGFFAGNRGPLRSIEHTATMFFVRRGLRRATPTEREETLNLSAVLVTLGFLLIVIGVALDPRYSLL
jgi:hypothetical protein